MHRIRVAFVKFAGLGSGGTERWLQMIAANLPRDQFDVDYFYCDAAPYVGSNYKHPDTDPHRLGYMQDHGVNLIKFSVTAKDVKTPTHDWVGTDFWEKFDTCGYDFVQTGKAGPAEYPYYLMKVPVVECVTLSAGVDSSPNTAWSFLLSQLQRREWIAAGGNWGRSSIVPVPVISPSSTNNLRRELGIPDAAIVGGFHQRVDDGIFSPVPLEAFAKVSTPEQHFVVMGGSSLYQEQAASLGLTNIHFVGQSGSGTRISEFLNSLDVFVHGRRDGETFGTVLAEAMMHGVPCLSHPSLVGNNNAQIETIGPGGLFAHGRAEYTAMLRTLLQDETLRRKLSAKARAHATEYYSLDACARKVAHTYRQLAGVGGLHAGSASPPAYEYSPRGYLQATAVDERSGVTEDFPVAGAPEQFEIELVRQLLPRMKIVVDVGARSGPFCLLAAKEIDPTGKVVAYETRPDCLANLREAIYLNNWEDRLYLRPMALDARGSRDRVQATASETGSDRDAREDASAASKLIAVDTLDNQVAEMHLDRLDLLRINSQRSELEVLRGAEDVIRQHLPVLLIANSHAVCEPHETDKGILPEILWLQERGYATYKCTRDFRLAKVGPNLPPLTSGSYICFRIGQHTRWEKQIRNWAFRRRIWGLLRYPAATHATTFQRGLGRLVKAIQNPRAAINAAVARAVPGYQNHARLGRGGNPRTDGPSSKRSG